MANISSVSFSRVSVNEGCRCDCCGQWIKNIWTVKYSDNVTMNFGIDCFEKLMKKSKLTDFGQKLLKKTLKRVEQYSEQLESYKATTEDTDKSYQTAQADWNKDDYWHGRPYAEFHEWMINEFYPQRFKECQKEIDRFKNVKFAR